MTLLRTLRTAMRNAPEGTLSDDAQRRLWADATARRDQRAQETLIARPDAPADLVTQWATIAKPAGLRVAYLLRPATTPAELDAAVADETRIAVLDAIARSDNASAAALRAVATKHHPTVARHLIERADTPPEAVIDSLATLASRYRTLPGSAQQKIRAALTRDDLDRATACSTLIDPGSHHPGADPADGEAIACAVDVAVGEVELPSRTQRVVVAEIARHAHDRMWRRQRSTGMLLRDCINQSAITDPEAVRTLHDTLSAVVGAGPAPVNDPAPSWLKALRERIPDLSDLGEANPAGEVRQLLAALAHATDTAALRTRARDLLHHPRLASDDFAALAAYAAPEHIVHAGCRRRPDVATVATVLARAGRYQPLPWDAGTLPDDDWLQVLDRVLAAASGQKRLGVTDPQLGAVLSLQRRGLLPDAGIARLPLRVVTAGVGTHETGWSQLAARVEDHLVHAAADWAAEHGRAPEELLELVDGIATPDSTATVGDAVAAARRLLSAAA